MGNTLIGDSLIMWNLLQEWEGPWIIHCIPYNLDVAEVIHKYVPTLNVKEIRVHSGNPAMDMRGLNSWIAAHSDNFPRDYVSYHTWQLKPNPRCVFSFPQTGFVRSPENLVTTQLSSEHGWKSWPEIVPAIVEHREVGTWKRVQSVRPGENCDINFEPFQHSLIEVAELLTHVKLHVGVSSAISWLAYLMGVPTVMCQPKGWDADCLTLEDHFRRLESPEIGQIHKAMDEVLTCTSLK
jgi:hypothetical protein